MKYGILKDKKLEKACVVNTFDEIDMCQPDMALTPQEIIEHFTQGLPTPNLQRRGYYDGDKYDFDDKLPDDFDDISDVQNEINDFKDRLNKLESERDELKRREESTKNKDESPQVVDNQDNTIKSDYMD